MYTESIENYLSRQEIQKEKGRFRRTPFRLGVAPAGDKHDKAFEKKLLPHKRYRV
jgi:hypothetical protein